MQRNIRDGDLVSLIENALMKHTTYSINESGSL